MRENLQKNHQNLHQAEREAEVDQGIGINQGEKIDFVLIKNVLVL